MFGGCNKLTSFEYDLSSLKNGNSMFRECNNLYSFKSDLSSLETGREMFLKCPFETFDYDLKTLTDATAMFNSCSNLSSFKSDLSSLIDGTSMFYNCKLDVPSVKNIIDTINTVETGEILIGMGCDNNQQDKDLFAQEVGYSDMNTLLQSLHSKGWTVTAQYNGRPTSNYSLRQPESLPVYIKLIEVIPTEEDDYTHYEYTSQDGTKFYNLDWFHETTGSTDTYSQFNSLEEAITHFNIKKTLIYDE
jgi:hypothetical protein